MGEEAPPRPYDLVSWGWGPRRKKVRVIVSDAALPGPSSFWASTWVATHDPGISPADLAHWPNGAGMLFQFTKFSQLSALHHSQLQILVHMGVSFVEFLIIYERTGHTLLVESVVPSRERAGLPLCTISRPAVRCAAIRLACQLIERILRALVGLPDGLHRLIPCSLGMHFV